jgi:tRNA(fMet)-specific endonuclease VapC
MGILIDADILINWERGVLDVESHTHGRNEEFYLSVITVSEMLHGVHRTTNERVRSRRTLFIQDMIGLFEVIPIDLAIAQTRSEITARLAELGQSIGSDDSWIAATCLTYNHSLITGNMREFSRIPGLRIETWQ